ncbi:MAG: acetate--CoA ligase family protein [Spirochaetes bacterium]|nr:acetate--CoA ligase family protein [Spirochaetota bacterium]
MENIISEAVKNGRDSLSEYESKIILKQFGIPVTREGLAKSEKEALSIASGIGYPLVLKGSGHKITHKTEMGLVRLNITSEETLLSAYREITSSVAGSGNDIEGVLVQEMLAGDREFILGLTRDRQFGPCVLFGLGGIYAEILKDVSMRIAPLSEGDAEEMLDEIKSKELLTGFRGSPAVNRDLLIKSLIQLGNIGLEYEEISEIDINPVIITGSNPVAVDSLIILSNSKNN